MADVEVSGRTAGIGRLGTTAAWVSAIACLPYLFLKALWTLDVPVGLADRSVLERHDWVAANAVMALVQLVAVVLAIGLVRPWSQRVPAWLILFPVWVGTGLLFQVIVGSAVVGVTSTASKGQSMETGGIDLWVYQLVYASFAVQGIALAVAFTCHVRARWGRLFGERTGAVLARRSGRARTWPQVNLPLIAEVLAVMAIAVALVCAYWAAGGSAGLSDARPHDNLGMQASRVAGAGVAAAGLLALAGRWGRRVRFWLPGALTWVGSGALVAFDGLVVVVTRLFALVGTDSEETAWAPVDLVLVVKAVIGVAAAVVGFLVARTAAET